MSTDLEIKELKKELRYLEKKLESQKKFKGNDDTLAMLTSLKKTCTDKLTALALKKAGVKL